MTTLDGNIVLYLIFFLGQNIDKSDHKLHKTRY